MSLNLHRHLKEDKLWQKRPVNGLGNPQDRLITIRSVVASVLFIYLLVTQDIIQSLLLVIDLLLGYTLFHARFGFTSAFCRFMSVGNVKSLRSHLMMLAVAVTLFAPILALNLSLFGEDVFGYVAPVGISLIVGAFLFSVGMQLGAGCASGTLYAVGSGRSVMFITLLYFIVGSTIGAKHLSFWTGDLPSFDSISLATSTGLGYIGDWILSIVLFGFIAWLKIIIEKKKQPPQMKPKPSAKGWKRLFRGSWPLLAAAVALAVLNALT